MTRINYGMWLWRIISWDTLLPATMLLVPSAIQAVFPDVPIQAVFPDVPHLLDWVSVSLPPVAFILRFYAGRGQIALNNCSRFVRAVQYAALVIGILPLVVVDFLVVQSHHGAAKGANLRELWILVGILVCAYLAAMVVAMYPGRTQIVVDP